MPSYKTVPKSTNRTTNKAHNNVSDVQYEKQDIPLNGKLITALDSTLAGPSDFQTLTNFEYTDASIRSVTGMTKINTNVPTYLKHRTIYQYTRTNPQESHLLTQSYNTDMNASVIQQMTNVVPATGDFSATTLYTIATTWAADTAYSLNDKVFPTTANGCYYVCSKAGTTHPTTEPSWSTTEFVDTTDNTAKWTCKKGDLSGTFNRAPDDCVVYTNGEDVLVWGGDEYRVAQFINYDTNSTFIYDFTNRLNNSSNDTANTAVFTRSGDSSTNFYICSMMPISGVKFYISTPNTNTASAPSISYWNGSAWTTVGTVTDGTSASSKTMAQTGLMSFADTSTVAKQKLINNVMGYWYKLNFSVIDATTSVYYCTLKTNFQKINDVWDGADQPCVSCMLYNGSIYTDYTTNVLKQDSDTYYSGSAWIYPPETYLPIGSATSSYAIFLGFTTRMTGVYLQVPNDQINTNASIASVYYWNGQAWTSCGTIEDQTDSSGKTLNTSGFYIWNPIDESSEFKTNVSTKTQLYYYKIVFGSTLSANIKIDYIAGMKAPIKLSQYNSSVMWLNSLWLIGDKKGWKSELLSSLTNTFCVFNSDSCVRLYLGNDDELIAGCTLFSRYMNNIEETLMVFKKNETWVVDGSNLDAIRPFKVSGQYGLTAPNSLAVCDIGVEIAPGVNKAVAIWQSNNDIMMFDNGSLICISRDIENYFKDMYDTSETERLNPDYVDKSYGFFDMQNKTYHWLFAAGSSTTLNREFVYDIIRKKWFRIDRTSGKYLQTGTSVKDFFGNAYTYGTLDTGYVERLEYGNTFDGADITSTFRLTDKPLDDTMFMETDVRFVKLIGVVKSSAGVVTMYYYGDVTDTPVTISTVDQSQTSKRVYQRTYGVNQSNVFHSFGLTCVSNDSFHAFEPLALAVLHHNIRYQTNRRES